MTTPTPDQIRDFVTAGHFNLAKVQSMLAENPELLNAAHPWSESDHETAIMAATQTGNVAIVEFLIAQGAPVDICTATMLGRREMVSEMLAQNPVLGQARGAHGIPLLAYASMSGDVELAQMLFARGATNGASFALGIAAGEGDLPMAGWLLENANPDLAWKNFKGKTALAQATEQGNQAMVTLLKQHGAME